MAEKFTGFANAVNAKGKTVDTSKVKPFTDETEAGKIRQASQTTPSSIVEFRTEGPSTNGAPMAVVGPKSSEPDADEAEGQEANEG